MSSPTTTFAPVGEALDREPVPTELSAEPLDDLSVVPMLTLRDESAHNLVELLVIGATSQPRAFDLHDRVVKVELTAHRRRTGR